jgi:hypothetical protein
MVRFTKISWLLCVGLIALLCGCERNDREVPPAPNAETTKSSTPAVLPSKNLPAKPPNPITAPATSVSAPPLLTKPFHADFVEMPGDVLPIWRQYRDKRPTLVIFSPDPMLMVIDPQANEQVAALVERGQPKDFLLRGRTQVADPIFLPSQTLTAALDSQFFSRILWVMPPPSSGQEIRPELLPAQMQQTGVLTAAEAEALTYDNGIHNGTLRGIPFMATIGGPLPKLDGPIILHFDFNFFSDQYHNEITTPIFTLLHNTLKALRQTGWQPLAVTFAISSEEGDFPLELRFIKTLLDEVFVNPKRLDEGLPESWALRKNAMYAETFFQTEAILDNYLHMEELRPKDASVKYDVYRALMMVKDQETALAYLDQAIGMDKGYAFEYIKLINTAKTKLRPAEALVYLKKVKKLLPQNPFVRLETVNVMMQLKMTKEARELVQELQGVPWSPVYYPNIRPALKELEAQVHSQPSAEQN